MLREFELGLANALGSRLAAPLAGAVDAAPPRNTARIVVRVLKAEGVDGELLSRRPERVPGAADPRRVLRLRCEVGLEMREPPGGSRVDQMLAIDRTLHLLGDAALLHGTALLPEDAAADPGFLIQSMRLARVETPLLVALSAEGYFWPVGQPGQSGVAIRELRIRESLLPQHLSPAAPLLLAGGAAVELTVVFGATGTLQLSAEAAEPTVLPFGSVLLSVVDAGGRPGAGLLSGGAAGPGGTRVVAVAAGQASVTYTPPASPAVDLLLVQLDDGEGGAGQTLGRLRLAVRSA